MNGYFGVGVWHLKNDVNCGGLVRAAYAFGAAFAFVVGKRFKRHPADTAKAWRHMPIFDFSTLDDLRKHLPYDCRIVGVETDGIHELPAFVHPERCCYLLGAEDHGLSPEVVRHCRGTLRIPTAGRCLNVAAAANIVLYDRFAKAAP